MSQKRLHNTGEVGMLARSVEKEKGPGRVDKMAVIILILITKLRTLLIQKQPLGKFLVNFRKKTLLCLNQLGMQENIVLVHYCPHYSSAKQATVYLYF